MFYYKKLLAFRLQGFAFQFENGVIGGHYMFLEEFGDIVNVEGIPYQYRAQRDNSLTLLRVRTSLTLLYLDREIFGLLQRYLKFNFVVRSSHQWQPQEEVLLGFADILLSPITSISSTISTHSNFQYYDKIWVKDVTFKESETFFLESFVPTLWLTFIGMFLLCSLLTMCVTIVLRKYKNTRSEIFNIVSLIMNQGVEHISAVWSCKIILFSLAVLLIIFFGSFEAFLSSLLAIKRISLPFNDLNGLFSQNEYILCLQENTVSYETAKFEIEHNKNFKAKINTEMCPVKFRMASKTSEVFDEINCNFGKIVIITPGNEVEFRKFAKRCNISPIPGKYLPQYTAFLLDPGFKHRKVLNRMIILFRTTGVIQNYGLRLDTLQRSEEPPSDVDDQDIHSIAFYQIHLIVGIFCIGAAFALIILLIEIFCKMAVV